MTLEQSVVMFVLMLVAQVPLLIAALISYLKSKAAIDENTKLTKLGTASATANARVAAETARDVKEAAQDLSKQLNGALDERITKIVKEHFDPLRNEVKAHAETDERNMAELKGILSDIKRSGISAVVTDEDLLKVLARKHGKTPEQVKAILEKAG